MPPETALLTVPPLVAGCSIVGLDMGFDNPVFAAIELDYAEADQVRGDRAGGQAQRLACGC